MIMYLFLLEFLNVINYLDTYLNVENNFIILGLPSFNNDKFHFQIFLKFFLYCLGILVYSFFLVTFYHV